MQAGSRGERDKAVVAREGGEPVGCTEAGTQCVQIGPGGDGRVGIRQASLAAVCDVPILAVCGKVRSGEGSSQAWGGGASVSLEERGKPLATARERWAGGGRNGVPGHARGRTAIPLFTTIRTPSTCDSRRGGAARSTESEQQTARPIWMDGPGSNCFSNVWNQ